MRSVPDFASLDPGYKGAHGRRRIDDHA